MYGSAQFGNHTRSRAIVHQCWNGLFHDIKPPLSQTHRFLVVWTAYGRANSFPNSIWERILS